jgi:hypothetical protein
MRTPAVIIVLAMLLPAAAVAEWELGIILGEPTGISANLWQGSSASVDLAAAWSFRAKASLHLHGDYLRYPLRIVWGGPESLRLYYGLGLRFRVRETENPAIEEPGLLGVRFPLGLHFGSRNHPLRLFLELSPVFNILPETSLDPNGALGIRYAFP